MLGLPLGYRRLKVCLVLHSTDSAVRLDTCLWFPKAHLLRQWKAKAFKAAKAWPLSLWAPSVRQYLGSHASRQSTDVRALCTGLKAFQGGPHTLPLPGLAQAAS